MERNYQNQLSLMSRRIEDLASKLGQAEKKNRKLEKKNSRRNSRASQEVDLSDHNDGSSSKPEERSRDDVREGSVQTESTVSSRESTPDEPDLDPEKGMFTVI